MESYARYIQHMLSQELKLSPYLLPSCLHGSQIKKMKNVLIVVCFLYTPPPLLSCPWEQSFLCKVSISDGYRFIYLSVKMVIVYLEKKHYLKIIHF